MRKCCKSFKLILCEQPCYITYSGLRCETNFHKIYDYVPLCSTQLINVINIYYFVFTRMIIISISLELNENCYSNDANHRFSADSLSLIDDDIILISLHLSTDIITCLMEMGRNYESLLKLSR